MASGSAIAVNDDLAAGQTTIAVGATDDETPGRIDEIARFFGQQFLGQNGANDFGDHRFCQLFMGNIRVMLGGNDDGIDRHRLAIHVANRQLALGVRTQPGQTAVLADFCLTLHDSVCIIYRQRHEGGGLVAGVSEHQPLIACPLVKIEPLPFIYPLGNIRRLPVDCRQDGTTFIIKADVGIVITDATNRLLRDFAIIDMRRCRDFSGNDDESG